MNLTQRILVVICGLLLWAIADLGMLAHPVPWTHHGLNVAGLSAWALALWYPDPAKPSVNVEVRTLTVRITVDPTRPQGATIEAEGVTVIH